MSVLSGNKTHSTITTSPLGCIIMASGMGKRFGGNKLLAPLGEKTLIQYILDTTSEIPFAKRLVITRHEAIAALCQKQTAEVLLHNMESRNDVINLAISSFHDIPLKGCLFCQADQPLLTRKSILTLIEHFLQQPDKIHRLSCDSTPGSPILFPTRLFPQLMSLPEGKGGSYLIHQELEEVLFTPIQNPIELFDVDTKDDLSYLESYLHKMPSV